MTTKTQTPPWPGTWYSDAPPSVDMRHWTNGGTALTNISPKDERKYLEAIEANGNPAYLIVRAPMDERGRQSKDYSLHCLDIQSRKDCSPFWGVYKNIATNMKAEQLQEHLVAASKAFRDHQHHTDIILDELANRFVMGPHHRNAMYHEINNVFKMGMTPSVDNIFHMADYHGLERKQI